MTLYVLGGLLALVLVSALYELGGVYLDGWWDEDGGDHEADAAAESDVDPHA